MQASKIDMDDSILYELAWHQNFTKEEKDALHNLIHLSSNVKLSIVFAKSFIYYTTSFITTYFMGGIELKKQSFSNHALSEDQCKENIV